MRPALIVFLAAAAAGPYRYSRPVEARPGWAVLELPDDVLDACRPGIPDLRVVDASGREVPFAFASDREAPARRLELRDVESVAKLETTAIVDRGPSPGFAESVTFEVQGPAEFLKPVRVESSEDGATWREVAHGSIFATASLALRNTLQIPETDRRYLRFRFDDRNGEPLRPIAVLLRAPASDTGGEDVDRPVVLTPIDTPGDALVSRYSAALPAANLTLRALRFEAVDPAYSRHVRVYERVLFRDEVCRCPLAEGVVSRSPGGAARVDLPVSGATARTLEIEIENQDSPPLGSLRVTARTRPARIRFYAPEFGQLALRYGSSSARRPAYDLPRALSGASATEFAVASLGPAAVSGGPRAEITPPRAPLPDAAKWTSRRAISLPASGAVAYLDFYDSPDLSGLRIVDADGRQVPFVPERGSHEHVRAAAVAVSQKGTRTAVRISLPEHAESITALELTASAPEYFRRSVSVREEGRDQRGPVEQTPLGAAAWERLPGQPAAPLRIPVSPRAGAAALLVEIDNGDNVPLTLGAVSLRVAATRIDFPFRPGERLLLLSGNPDAAAPRYDLELLADTILGSPAAAARLEAPRPAAPARADRPPWLFVGVAVAAAALLFQLSRTLRAA